MAWVGFESEVLTKSINDINAAYGQLENVLYTKMQNEFINIMAEKWACNEAIEFFQKLKLDVDSLLLSSYDTFFSVNETMNKAGNDWDITTQSEKFFKVPFEYGVKDVDVSGIKENINGGSGVDPTASEQQETLKGFLPQITEALENAQSAVVNNGLLDEGTSSALQQSITKIKNSAENVCTDLITACDAKVNETLERYGALANTQASNMTA